MSDEFKINRPRFTRQRNRKSNNTLIRSIIRLNEDSTDGSVSLAVSMGSLRESRLRLQHHLNKVIKQEKKLRKQTEEFQKAKDELEDAAKDMKTLYEFKENGADTALNFQIAIALDDAAVAQQQIKRIEKELYHMSPIVKETRDIADTSVRCYDEVVIPELSVSEMSNPDITPTRTCSICMENEADCVIVDCGHVCMCLGCVPNFLTEAENCPICRAQISEIFVPKPI